ncbi:MAG: N-acyl homoserine lactonase family protein [Solirubrobacterales bacterium]
MKVHAAPKPLTGPLPGGTGGATVTVHPLSGGEVQFPAASFERPGGPFESLKVTGLFTSRSSGWIWVPCPAFLITHPTAGSVLVDTSLHSSIAAEPSENFGRAAAWVARPRIESGKDLPSQLRELGAEPRSISFVVMTHLHVDHASGISEFPSSTFVLSSAEWEAATAGSRPILRGYRPQHYDFAFDYRLVDFDGGRVDSYATFGRTVDLFGDGSIRLAFTPGHTLGHMSVLARLRDRDFVIAGDAVYTMRQLEGGPAQPRPQDPHLWRRSLQELQLFHRQYPQAVISPGHDAEHWRSLDARYE